MKIEKTVNGEKFIFYFKFLLNSMKVQVRLFQEDEWTVCDISDNFKYILLPENKFVIDGVEVKKLKLNKHQIETAKEYNSKLVKNENNTMKLLYVEVTVSTNAKMKARVVEHEAEEKSKTYTYTNKVGDTKRVKKDDIMKIDSFYTNTISDHYGMIGFHVYCLPEDEEKAKKILKNKVHKKIEALNDSTSKLIMNYRDI